MSDENTKTTETPDGAASALSAGLGKPLAEVTDVDWLRQEVQHLWCLLDDIDTASDIASDNDEWYRKRVEFLQRQRFNTVTSDGSGLFVALPNLNSTIPPVRE